MKKLILLLSLVIIPLSTGFSFTIFDKKNNTNFTESTSFQKNRSDDFVPAEFSNEGLNILYRENITEEFRSPAINIEKRNCLTWKSCMQKSFKKTRGYNRSYLEKKVDVGDNKFSTLPAWRRNSKGFSLRRIFLPNELTGQEQLKRLRNIPVSKKDRTNQRNN